MSECILGLLAYSNNGYGNYHNMRLLWQVMADIFQDVYTHFLVYGRVNDCPFFNTCLKSVPLPSTGDGVMTGKIKGKVMVETTKIEDFSLPPSCLRNSPWDVPKCSNATKRI